MCKTTVFNKELATYTIETRRDGGFLQHYRLTMRPTDCVTLDQGTFVFEPNEFNKIEPKICEIEKKLKILHILYNHTSKSIFSHGEFDDSISEDFFEDIAEEIMKKFNL